MVDWMIGRIMGIYLCPAWPKPFRIECNGLTVGHTGYLARRRSRSFQPSIVHTGPRFVHTHSAESGLLFCVAGQSGSFSTSQPNACLIPSRKYGISG
jgi:hypothetical protein